jgi:hypothetical protein
MLPPENTAKTTGDFGNPQFKFDKNERIFYMGWLIFSDNLNTVVDIYLFVRFNLQI